MLLFISRIPRAYCAFLLCISDSAVVLIAIDLFMLFLCRNLLSTMRSALVIILAMCIVLSSLHESESAAAAGAAVNYGRDTGYAHRARRPSKFQFDELFADSEGGTGEEVTSEGAESSISE
ncbi:hypothetical protein OS493_011166 [Desmophyllum pertusum]|uniref:Uncharacterized protein n=1 Tax=Desmophyllum pertusum TaxID=174260 RepID=A0A9W9Z1E3_9CNID|nr:hypothetical protein OS493_011166 [Desmophyllum pertusum]